MGNCLRHGSSSKWAAEDDGDDWDIPAAEGGFAASATNGAGSAGSKSRAMEVKIKITKKQLEELLGKVDVRELRVEQVLAQLMNHSRGGYESLQKPWRPALQSIPEVN